MMRRSPPASPRLPLEDGPAVIGLFVADDVDGNDVPGNLIYTILSQPAEGTVASNGDGSFTFTPGTAFQDLAEGETRLVSFTYQAKDQSGAASNIATGTITVTGKNDAPTAANLAVTVTEGQASAPIAFKGDDIDSDDTPATLATPSPSRRAAAPSPSTRTAPSSSIREPISIPCSRARARP